MQKATGKEKILTINYVLFFLIYSICTNMAIYNNVQYGHLFEKKSSTFMQLFCVCTLSNMFTIQLQMSCCVLFLKQRCSSRSQQTDGALFIISNDYLVFNLHISCLYWSLVPSCIHYLGWRYSENNPKSSKYLLSPHYMCLFIKHYSSLIPCTVVSVC